jgi:predicted nucleic acid-binding protein
VSGGREGTTSEAAELRVVVDAQIVLAMFLARRDNPGWSSPKRQLLKLLAAPSFHWLWSPDIIADYERGALAVEADERIMRRAVFDRLGFELFLAALRLTPVVRVSATTTRKARRRIEQAPRIAERDLDDAIYLACAMDGGAHLITTEDSDLRALGDEYEGILILSWNEFRDYLRRQGLIVEQGE